MCASQSAGYAAAAHSMLAQEQQGCHHRHLQALCQHSLVSLIGDDSAWIRSTLGQQQKVMNMIQDLE
jgi:hypothetical protein